MTTIPELPSLEVQAQLVDRWLPSVADNTLYGTMGNGGNSITPGTLLDAYATEARTWDVNLILRPSGVDALLDAYAFSAASYIRGGSVDAYELEAAVTRLLKILQIVRGHVIDRRMRDGDYGVKTIAETEAAWGRVRLPRRLS